MPAKGSSIFLQFPNEAKRRILHPTRVTDLAGPDNYTLLPENQEMAFQIGQELLIYYEKRRQFMQQPARIEALLEGEKGNVVVIQSIGEPVSAESRQCYRVSTVLSGLSVTFDGVENCSLRDVSVTGFAVISPGSYKTGQVLIAELVHEGRKFTGRVSIQSVTKANDGKTRYGVNCVKAVSSPTSLSKGVQQISMAVQRQQLSRLSGGA